MVEGPGVHRVALVHRRMLQGCVFQATSPSGRFVDGAAAINGRVLSHIEAHVKNIFYLLFISILVCQAPSAPSLILDLSHGKLQGCQDNDEAIDCELHSEENCSNRGALMLSSKYCLGSCTQVAQEAAAEGVPIVSVYTGMVYGPGKLTAGNSLALMVMFQIYQSFLEAQ
ncbi:unnamed protein product [Sphagnum jensenii]|uniref:Uncharacterized protein n=2 Tax=Sphagnum jensenii TaxID=128206 RepID=A0ABP0XB02_9BRYO